MATVDELKPTVDDVALLMRTRTVSGVSTGLGADTGSAEVTTFTADTRPSADEVARIIDSAEGSVIGELPVVITDLPEEQNDAVRNLVALYAAILLEASFFRENANDALIQLWRDLYADGLAGVRGYIASVTPGAARAYAMGTLVIGGIRSTPVPNADPVPGLDDDWGPGVTP